MRLRKTQRTRIQRCAHTAEKLGLEKVVAVKVAAVSTAAAEEVV